MRYGFLAVAAAAFLTAPTVASAAVEGLWMVENGKAVVELARCEGASLCGSIHWLREDAKQYDYQNENAALRETPLCGLKILWGFTQAGPDAWADGMIYKADDGDTYHAEVRLNDDGTLYLRGHVGVSFLGKTQTWTPVSASQYKKCQGPTGTYDPALARKDKSRANGVND